MSLPNILMLQSLYLLHGVKTDPGTHPTLYPLGTGNSFPEGKAIKPAHDHSPPSSVEVNNGWSYSFTSPYSFRAWCSSRTDASGIRPAKLGRLHFDRLGRTSRERDMYRKSSPSAPAFADPTSCHDVSMVTPHTTPLQLDLLCMYVTRL